jgi:hypothetical protein
MMNVQGTTARWRLFPTLFIFVQTAPAASPLNNAIQRVET